MKTSEIIERSTLKPDEKKFILSLMNGIGADFDEDLFEIENYIDDNTLNHLREIAISYIEDEVVDKNIENFRELLLTKKKYNSEKRLAFAKSLNETTTEGSLLEYLDVDLLNKIGEILKSFSNFHPIRLIIQPGTKVGFHSLVNNPDKNGHTGVVISLSPISKSIESGRYKVKLSEGGRGYFFLKNLEWVEEEIVTNKEGGGKRRKKYSKKKKKSKKKKGKSKRKRSKTRRRR